MVTCHPLGTVNGNLLVAENISVWTQPPTLSYLEPRCLEGLKTWLGRLKKPVWCNWDDDCLFSGEEMSVPPLWQKVDVGTLVSSLTGAGRIIGTRPWLQNNDDYMWHWSRLWLRAKRWTRKDHVGRKEPQCSHSSFPHPIFFLSFT